MSAKSLPAILPMAYDRTKNGLVYAKPGNRCVAKSHDEAAGGEDLQEGVSLKKPMRDPYYYE